MSIDKEKLKEIIPYIFGILFVISVGFQFSHHRQFINKGPRFTANDGQELCERVRALELDSYGFKDKGRQLIPCDYAQRTQK